MKRSNGLPSLGLVVVVVVALWAAQAWAQFTNWQAGQINTTLCYWKQPRAALVRDMVYLDGGSIWWSPGLDSGEFGTPVSHGNLQGLILAYNLSDAFTPQTNVTALLLKNEISKARGGKIDSLSSEPNYIDGALLGNDAEFFLYGGAMLRLSTLYDDPAADQVLKYTAYSYGVDKPLFKAGLLDSRLNNDVTRYVAYGAGVSAPSENMAWYFSGMTSPSRGPFYSNGFNETTRAVSMSDTLISVDMATQLSETWANDTLPADVKGRANAEAVWVPVGKRGILVVLGGVVYPEWATNAHKSQDAEASKRESPEFMRVMDIYDVDAKKWYKQATHGGPGTRARGCAVVAAAADRSSFNIYYYGGFDGISPTLDFYDDVWVLSLPSFTWVQLNGGAPLHARAGHRCFSPYPDQMMAFGGYASEGGAVPSCLDKGPVVLLNMTSGEWLDSYDPDRHGAYGVPDKVRAVIGGDASGGATASAPGPSGWDSVALGDVFAQRYDMDKMKQHWPYTSATPTGRPGLEAGGGGGGGGDGKMGIIVPAVVVPIVALGGVALVAWRCARRRRRRRRGSDEAGAAPDEAALRIRSWMCGQSTAKSLDAAASEAPLATPPLPPPLEALKGEAEAAAAYAYAPVVHEPTPSVQHEMEDTQVAELDDTSPPAELHGTGLAGLGGTESASPTVADSPLWEERMAMGWPAFGSPAHGAGPPPTVAEAPAGDDGLARRR